MDWILLSEPTWVIYKSVDILNETGFSIKKGFLSAHRHKLYTFRPTFVKFFDPSQILRFKENIVMHSSFFVKEYFTRPRSNRERTVISKIQYIMPQISDLLFNHELVPWWVWKWRFYRFILCEARSDWIKD